MSAAQMLGAAMLVVLFLGTCTWMARDTGWGAVLLAWGIATIITAVVGVAISLLVDGTPLPW